MVERRARVTMRGGVFSPFEELNLARHRGIGESARRRINVTQQCAIVRIALTVTYRLQSFIRVLPSVTERHSSPVGFVCLRRPRETQTADGFAGLARDLLCCLIVLFEEQNVEGLDQRSIQTVQP